MVVDGIESYRRFELNENANGAQSIFFQFAMRNGNTIADTGTAHFFPRQDSFKNHLGRQALPLERQGLQNLLNERKIIRAAQENGTVAINNRIPLQSLTAANIMVEGSIIGYESNVKSGGVGARYFGIGADTQYQLDQIAVNLRVVNVSTGEILSSVNTSKTILSYEVQAGVFRFIDYQRLLEGEVGYTSNEPVMLCLMSAIETGVIFLINDGIDRGLWDLQNKAERQNDILVKYRHMSVPPES